MAATGLFFAGLGLLGSPADAQQAPSLTIQKVAVGGSTTATFDVSGPGIDGTVTLSADAIDGAGPAVAGPPLTGLVPGGNYLIEEILPEEGVSPFELTSIECTDGQTITGGQRSVIVTLTEDVTCTFTNTLTRAAIRAVKNVVGNTGSWVRPARFHISCPDIEVDMEIEPPVGPGGPGTYIIGQGTLPPATCTISEIDTGSDAPVSVTMVMTNHGVPIAVGTTSLTFTADAGDDLVLIVTNGFPFGDTPGQEPAPTTTVAGGSTTTVATTTTVPGGTTTTVPGGGGATTTVPGGSGATTTSAAATTTTPGELPTTGRASRGLVVIALASMVGGVFLVARTRRPAEVRVEKRRD